MRSATTEPATWAIVEGNHGRFAGWALTEGGRMIWTQWRRTYTRAHCELQRKARRAGVVLRWWDGVAGAIEEVAAE